MTIYGPSGKWYTVVYHTHIFQIICEISVSVSFSLYVCLSVCQGRIPVKHITWSAVPSFIQRLSDRELFGQSVNLSLFVCVCVCVCVCLLFVVLKSH